MTENEFYSLLIEVIRKDKHPQKRVILDLLQRAQLTCEKTGLFTRRKWNHYQEFIYLTVSPTDLVPLMDFKDYIEKTIEKIYPINNEYEYEFWGLEIKPGKVIPNESVSQEIHFTDIEQQILDEIDSAKYTIWIAMAWFTNRKFYDALCKKKQAGVNIQIRLDDNAKNESTPFNLEKEFETYRVTIQSAFKNIMHDKFCIIDFKTVIHGTFNWTNAANYNKETISVDHNSATAYTFADEFMNLKREAMVQKDGYLF